mmetsp:Transcript_50569/g.163365  ORF Transcript_50569/g.163365 Transcript_50569/m.163365 type:complete len:306 (+) Transcript_50569:2535-3452(+)
MDPLLLVVVELLARVEAVEARKVHHAAALEQLGQHDEAGGWHLVQPQSEVAVRCPVRARRPGAAPRGGKHGEEVARDEEERGEDDVVPSVADRHRGRAARDVDAADVVGLQHVAPERGFAPRVLLEPLGHERVEAHHRVKGVDLPAEVPLPDRRAVAHEQHPPHRLAAARHGQHARLARARGRLAAAPPQPTNRGRERRRGGGGGAERRSRSEPAKGAGAPAEDGEPRRAERRQLKQQQAEKRREYQPRQVGIVGQRAKGPKDAALAREPLQDGHPERDGQADEDVEADEDPERAQRIGHQRIGL